MSQPTYSARMLMVGDDRFAVEQPNNAVTGHPYFDLPVVLGVFNKPGSGKVVHVSEINVKPMTTAQSVVGCAVVQRITAASAAFSVVSSEKLDTNNAALPAEVSCLYLPRTLTTTANTVMRRIMVQPELNFTRALSTLTSKTQGDGRNGFDSGEIMAHMDAATQSIVLREGQGISISNSIVNNMPINAYSVTVLVRNQSSGACYRFNKVIEPRQPNGGAVLSLMNGSGSGVVLEVGRIQIREIGTDEEPMVAYERIEALCEDCSETPDVSSHDTATPLDSNIVCLGNAMAVRVGSKMGALITIPAQRRVQVSESPFYEGFASLQMGRRGIFDGDMALNATTRIVLREGEGIGIRKINPSAKLCHEAQIQFHVVSPAAVYPVAGDVDQGVTYGPSGTDYTGTLEQPAVADVKTGVQYGAGGTEFTGTYVGGGGTTIHPIIGGSIVRSA